MTTNMMNQVNSCSIVFTCVNLINLNSGGLQQLYQEINEDEEDDDYNENDEVEDENDDEIEEDE